MINNIGGQQLSDAELDLVSGGAPQDQDKNRRNDNVPKESYPRGGRNDNDRSHRVERPNQQPRRDDNQQRL